jgi:hypothetical protein
VIVADEEDTTSEAVVAVVREHQSRCEAVTGQSSVLDTPLFTPSHRSHGIQACDLAAFLRSRRAFARSDEDPRAKRAQAAWWAMIEPHVVEDDCHPAPTQTDLLFEKPVPATVI